LKALSNIDLEIPDSSIFGIIGRSGAGKSTLVRCVNLLERPDSGSVSVSGVELTDLGEGELRQAGKDRHDLSELQPPVGPHGLRNVAFPSNWRDGAGGYCGEG
jgi:ABC-type oligopeptide transport system ATPase subunit